jgi:hypothetical protein
MHPCPLHRIEAERQLPDPVRHEQGGQGLGHVAHAGLRGRLILHDVQQDSRRQVPSAGVRDHTMPAEGITRHHQGHLGPRRDRDGWHQ